MAVLGMTIFNMPSQHYERGEAGVRRVPCVSNRPLGDLKASNLGRRPTWQVKLV